MSIIVKYLPDNRLMVSGQLTKSPNNYYIGNTQISGMDIVVTKSRTS